MDETFARAILFALLCTGLVLLAFLIRRVWRALRRVSVESVARTAGALTSAAQRRTEGVAKAFKDGRGQ